MQHHIWLSTNAKTLLTLVPGNYPWVNFVATTIIYVAVSHRLFRLTISLRAMLIPNTTRYANPNQLVVVVKPTLVYILVYHR